MVEINLLPQQYRKQTEPSAWKFATYALIPLTVAAILIPEVMTATTVGNLKGQLDELNGQVAALTPAKREFDQLTQEKNQLDQVATIANQLKQGKTYWTNDLAAFTAQLPSGSGVALKNMTIKPVDAGSLSSMQQSGVYVGRNVTREIELSGEASSQAAIVNFLKTFENNPNFGVNFKSMQGDATSGKYTFSAAVGVVGSTEAPSAATSTAPAGSPSAAPAVPAAPATPASGSAQGGSHVN